MDKYPKTDLEFEALFESVFRKKVDASQLHELQKKAIVDQIRSKSYGKSIQNKGFENSLAKPRIKTKLYLGKTAGGKKVYFNVEFSKQIGFISIHINMILPHEWKVPRKRGHFELNVDFRVHNLPKVY